jgi:hypothetical protein
VGRSGYGRVAQGEGGIGEQGKLLLRGEVVELRYGGVRVVGFVPDVVFDVAPKDVQAGGEQLPLCVALLNPFGG